METKKCDSCDFVQTGETQPEIEAGLEQHNKDAHSEMITEEEAPVAPEAEAETEEVVNDEAM